MKTIRTLFAALISTAALATAADYHAYRASTSLPMQHGEYVSGIDRIVTTKLGTPQLINIALGRPLTDKVPPETILALLVPVGGAASDSRVVVLNKLNISDGIRAKPRCHHG